MQHDTVCPLPNHRLTFTNTWHLNRRTIPWPQSNLKDVNRTRSVSRWLCAAMLMARISFHFLSLANTKTLAASKTSTETALDANTEATRRLGWHKSSFSSGWKGLMRGWQGCSFDYGQLQRTYPVNATRICCYTPQHNHVLSATKHDLEDSALRRRNYLKPQRLLSAPFQSPPHSTPLGQGSRPQEDRHPRGYAHCYCSLEHGCEARNNPQLLSPLPNLHHRCWCDTGPRRATYWP